MSALVFPALAGTVLVKRTPLFKNTIHESASGKEDRTEWAAVRYRWDLRNEVLRTAVAAPSPYGTYNEKTVVEYFFETVGRGTNESFHILDPMDGVTDHTVRFAEDSLDLEWVCDGIYAVNFSLISVL